MIKFELSLEKEPTVVKIWGRNLLGREECKGKGQEVGQKRKKPKKTFIATV